MGIGAGNVETSFDMYHNVELFFDGITHVQAGFPHFFLEFPHSQMLCVRDKSGKNTEIVSRVIYGISEFTQDKHSSCRSCLLALEGLVGPSDVIRCS